MRLKGAMLFLVVALCVASILNLAVAFLLRQGESEKAGFMEEKLFAMSKALGDTSVIKQILLGEREWIIKFWEDYDDDDPHQGLAPGGDCYPWKSYTFTLDNPGDLYIFLSGWALSTAQNVSGDDDDLSVQLDSTYFGWNNEYSLDGNAQKGCDRMICIRAKNVTAGAHTVILWADETPRLSSTLIFELEEVPALN